MGTRTEFNLSVQRDRNRSRPFPGCSRYGLRARAVVRPSSSTMPIAAARRRPAPRVPRNSEKQGHEPILTFASRDGSSRASGNRRRPLPCMRHAARVVASRATGSGSLSRRRRRSPPGMSHPARHSSVDVALGATSADEGTRGIDDRTRDFANEPGGRQPPAREPFSPCSRRVARSSWSRHGRIAGRPRRRTCISQ